MSKDFYDRVAKEFGGYSFITRKSEHETVFPSVDPENVFKSKLLEYSGKDVRVVDVGCGDCRFAFSIAGNFKEVVGVDTSIELLKVAAEKMEKNGITNVRFMEVDAGKTGFEDNSFDLSFSRRGPTPYEEIGRILKPGGRFIVIEVMPTWNYSCGGCRYSKILIRKKISRYLPDMNRCLRKVGE